MTAPAGNGGRRSAWPILGRVISGPTSASSLASRLAAGVAQSSAVSAVARRVTAGHLRILAFHGVPDRSAFDLVIREALRHHTPVSEGQVAQAIREGNSLPNNAVWFTFDDGLASTFDSGPLLASHGVSATAFVCPGAIEPPTLLWFQVVEACLGQGLIAPQELGQFSLRQLKRTPDAERRAITEELRTRLEGSGKDVAGVNVDTLRAWVALGHHLGNHTWDHPMLDQCDASSQRAQVSRAHQWLVAHEFETRFFAFPNGNWADAAAAEARRLGYEPPLLFDHRLTRPNSTSRALSRLRIDSDASPARVRGILSGAHSGIFHLSGKA